MGERKKREREVGKLAATVLPFIEPCITINGGPLASGVLSPVAAAVRGRKKQRGEGSQREGRWCTPSPARRRSHLPPRAAVVECGTEEESGERKKWRLGLGRTGAGRFCSARSVRSTVRISSDGQR
jgi:hypothetical protein